MKTLTETWQTQCRMCGEPLYYYPAKLVLESTTQPPINMNEKRILHLTCTNPDCKHIVSFEFPLEFKKFE